VSGFNALRATAERAQPFDRARRGLVLGEGAGIVVVEAEEHARRRGATVHAEIAGSGAAADATHMTAPDREGRGAARAMRAALDAAGAAASSVQFVSAHGTGTVYNDAMEAAAIGAVFGAGVAVNSVKGAIGHTLGAAGALEVIVCTEALRTGVVPPTAGLVDVDPACAALDLVRGEARRLAVRTALSTSSGFAGANAAVVLRAP
jgi:3-oxoacyl-[acyl-carrier-protein] synthase II